VDISGLDINVCPIPVKTDVGQVDLVLRLSDGTSEKNQRFPNVTVRQTNLFPPGIGQTLMSRPAPASRTKSRQTAEESRTIIDHERDPGPQ
jgi:hypothetical protein